jgi:hypothetical protein
MKSQQYPNILQRTGFVSIQLFKPEFVFGYSSELQIEYDTKCTFIWLLSPSKIWIHVGHTEKVDDELRLGNTDFKYLKRCGFLQQCR